MIKKIIKYAKLENNEVIVSLTSWTKRINYIKPTLESIFNQSYQPNKIVLNLSLKEFPNKEKDLPEFINEYIKNNIFEINWLNDNLKNFKKNLPLIKKYINNPNVILFVIDDDIIYGKDYIKDLLYNFLQENKFTPTVITWYFSQDEWWTPLTARVYGYCSIYRPIFFTPLVYSITELDLEKYFYLSEDNWISLNLHKNNIRFKIFELNELNKHLTIIDELDTSKYALTFTRQKNNITQEILTKNVNDCYNDKLKLFT